MEEMRLRRQGLLVEISTKCSRRFRGMLQQQVPRLVDMRLAGAVYCAAPGFTGGPAEAEAAFIGSSSAKTDAFP